MVLNLEMVRIPAGRLLRGEYTYNIDSFHLGAYTITQAQFLAVMGYNPAALDPKAEDFLGPDYPVICVTAIEAFQFCERLSRRTGDSYRLPTRWEWEYACRAGTTGDYYFDDPLAAGCNWDGTREGTGYAKAPWPVDQCTPNGYGLYHMHGNVWEMCMWQEEGLVPIKGGSWYSYPKGCTSGYTADISSEESDERTGFRVVCD